MQVHSHKACARLASDDAEAHVETLVRLARRGYELVRCGCTGYVRKECTELRDEPGRWRCLSEAIRKMSIVR